MVSKSDIESFIKDDLRINKSIKTTEDSNSITSVVDIFNSDQYGIVFSKLDRNNNLESMDDNQIVTEDDSSLLYTTKEGPNYIINLTADYASDIYQLIVTYKKGN